MYHFVRSIRRHFTRERVVSVGEGKRENRDILLLRIHGSLLHGYKFNAFFPLKISPHSFVNFVSKSSKQSFASPRLASTHLSPSSSNRWGPDIGLDHQICLFGACLLRTYVPLCAPKEIVNTPSEYSHSTSSSDDSSAHVSSFSPSVSKYPFAF